MKAIDIIGDKYSRLRVLVEIPREGGERLFVCLCDCGNLTINTIGSLRSGNTKSCGCLHIETSTARVLQIDSKGSSNGNWKGGITMGDSYRRTTEYKEWRFSVYKRDDFTCQKCGESPSGLLQAHHILAKSRYPEHMHRVENGITLCRRCHLSGFHKLYGTKTFTSEDFWEWLND